MALIRLILGLLVFFLLFSCKKVEEVNTFPSDGELHPFEVLIEGEPVTIEQAYKHPYLSKKGKYLYFWRSKRDASPEGFTIWHLCPPIYEDKLGLNTYPTDDGGHITIEKIKIDNPFD